MFEITIDEKRLEELIEKTVQKHLKSSLEDMEKVRHSPGGAIVRLEARVESVEKNMATKTDLANLRNELVGRIAKLETGQKLMFTVFLSMFGAVIVMLVKLVFFP